MEWLPPTAGESVEPADERSPTVDAVVSGRLHLPSDDGESLNSLPPARRPELLSSVAVLVPDVAERAGAVVAAVLEWSPRQLRVDVIGCDPGRFHSDGAQGTPDGGPVLRRLVDPPGDRRVDRIEALMAVVESELVVVPPRVPPLTSSDLDRVLDCIGHLWVTGADIAVAPLAGGARPVGGTDDDPARRLSRSLGLVAGHPGALVVLRRWTARWLFEGISRVIEPVHELHQRAVDLDVGMIELVAD
jgi:hypothetical protein